MANIKYSEMLDEVLPSLSADPSDPVTENAIKRSVIDFCARSWVWRHLPDPLDVSAGEAAYDIELPAGSDVAALMNVAIDGFPLVNKSVDWLDASYPGWRTTTGTPQYYTQIDTEQLILACVPDTNGTGALSLTLSLQPSQSATSFPKWIFNQFLYTLVDGAMAKLLLMPNKPWTDLGNGQMRLESYDRGIANARASASIGLARAPLRAKSHH